MPYISKRKVGNPNKIDKQEARDRHNDKWNIFYQNRRYKKLRSWYMTNHPLCEMCMFNGRSVPATECHHRTPISTGVTMEDKMNLLLDEKNLCALCSSCHDKIHASLKPRS